jgi:hypothetical protein
LIRYETCVSILLPLVFFSASAGISSRVFEAGGALGRTRDHNRRREDFRHLHRNRSQKERWFRDRNRSRRAGTGLPASHI